MSLLEILGDVIDTVSDTADPIKDSISGISATVGGETYEDLFTKGGEILGGGWNIVGKAADSLTDDINVDIDDLLNN